MVDRWCGQTRDLNDLVRRVKRIVLEKIANAKCRSCSVTLYSDPLPIFLKKIEDLGRSLKRLIGSAGDAGQEKVYQASQFPCSRPLAVVDNIFSDGTSDRG